MIETLFSIAISLVLWILILCLFLVALLIIFAIWYLLSLWFHSTKTDNN